MNKDTIDNTDKEKVFKAVSIERESFRKKQVII